MLKFSVGRSRIEMLAEGRIYTFFRSQEERLYVSKRPREAGLANEEKRMRIEARS
ncbi:MAG: hypothetical protein KF868_00195 [Acidobacteria bacterium]|nr:hypothetical protein [Acidobacteriota bacterium]MCW5969463.1 hypothetical protein [Blastocatellales bacterium]